jgi:hypothetical protein
MAVETLPYIYTDQTTIERLYSDTGVTLVIDDMSSGEKALFWTEVTSEASDVVNQYAEMYYAPIDLNTSSWVQRRTTWIAAYLISQRRGNPAIFGDRYDEIIEELKAVYRGELLIPRMPTREDMTPAMSNLIVDDRFRVHKLRVHPTISTGGVSSRQDMSPRFPWEWL